MMPIERSSTGVYMMHLTFQALCVYEGAVSSHSKGPNRLTLHCVLIVRCYSHYYVFQLGHNIETILYMPAVMPLRKALQL